MLDRPRFDERKVRFLVAAGVVERDSGYIWPLQNCGRCWCPAARDDQCAPCTMVLDDVPITEFASHVVIIEPKWQAFECASVRQDTPSDRPNLGGIAQTGFWSAALPGELAF